MWTTQACPWAGAKKWGWNGCGPDGQVKTREVKLAALFTQRTTEAEGHPGRDPDSNTYLGSFATPDAFGLW